MRFSEEQETKCQSVKWDKWKLEHCLNESGALGNEDVTQKGF